MRGRRGSTQHVRTVGKVLCGPFIGIFGYVLLWQVFRADMKNLRQVVPPPFRAGDRFVSHDRGCQKGLVDRIVFIEQFRARNKLGQAFTVMSVEFVLCVVKEVPDDVVGCSGQYKQVRIYMHG